MSFAHQVRLLLWKNWTLRRRHKRRLIVELIWPLFLFVILAWVRTRGLQYAVHECHFDPKALPTAGAVALLHGLVCSFNNTCRAAPASAQSSVLAGWQRSIVHTLDELTETLNNSAGRPVVAAAIDVARDVLALRQKWTWSSAAPSSGKWQLNEVFVNASALTGVLKKYGIGETNWQRGKLYEAHVTVDSVKTVLTRVVSRVAFGRLNDTVCDLDVVQYLVTFDEQSFGRDFVKDLCNIGTDRLWEFSNDLYSVLDTEKVYGSVSNVLSTMLGRSVHLDDWLSAVNEFVRLIGRVFSTTVVPRVSSIFSQWLQPTNTSSINSTFSEDNPLYHAVRLQESVCGIDLAKFFMPSVRDNRLPINQLRDRIREQTSEKNFRNSSASLDECDELYRSVEVNPFSRIFWRALKPMVYGKVVYAPESLATFRLVSRINKTFAPFHKMLVALKDWPRQVEIARPFISQSLPVLGRLGFVLNTLPIWESLQTNANNIFGTLPSVLRESIDLGRILGFNSSTSDEFLIELNDSVERLINGSLAISHYLARHMLCVCRDKFVGMSDEESLVEYSRNLSKDGLLWAGLVFLNVDRNATQLPTLLRYKIRMDGDRVDSTKRVLDRLTRLGPRQRPYEDLKYVTYGFAYLQDIVDRALIEDLSGRSVDIGIYLHQMPYPCYIDDKFILAISRTFPMFMVLAWVYSSSMIVKSIVYEKEQRLKEIMLILGLRSSVHWICWFITSFVLMAITNVMLTFILVFGNVLQYSNPVIVFIFLLCYSTSTICFSFFLSTLFSRANLAAAAGGLIFFISYLPYPFLIIWEDRLSYLVKWTGCFLSNVAFGFGCSYLAHYEERGIGIQWSTINSSPIFGDDFNLLQIVMSLLTDSVVYTLLALYLDAVLPGQYGVALPWYFLCSSSYWRGFSSQRNQIGQVADEEKDRRRFETEPEHLPVGVSISHLKKVYPNGKKAVEDLSINFYQDQITSFLGHNGAGKTTTISVLTGLISATYGSVKIYGHDINENLSDIRKNLGICPQYNTLFDELTVLEHLTFYARLKCQHERDVRNEEIKLMLEDLGLGKKGDEKTKHLSGGMQRKLSLAIAFIGGSRTVILDEPTSGVDPFSRRSIWELLLKYKKERTVILTTHFMDEADILGDRIAIISGGKLQCCGSSVFLKRQFGSGYYLTLVRVKLTEAVERNSSSTQVCEENQQRIEFSDSWLIRLTELIQQHVASAELWENLTSEVTYMIPASEDMPHHIALLLEELDTNLENFKVASYGISDAPLEEIFLKLADGEGSLKTRFYPRRLDRNNSMSHSLTVIEQPGHLASVQSRRTNDCSQINCVDVARDSVASCNGETSRKDYLRYYFYETVQKGFLTMNPPVFFRHFFALCVKRFHHTRRNMKGLVFELILPALFVCLAMIFTLILPPLEEEPPLSLSPWLYDQPFNIFFSNDDPESSVTRHLEHELISHYGIGTRCVDTPTLCKEVAWPKVWAKNPIPSDVSCSCSTGSMVCSEGISAYSPVSHRISSGDYLLNVSGYDVADWMVKTRPEYYKIRWGGFTFGFINPVTEYNRSAILESWHKFHSLFSQRGQLFGRMNLGEDEVQYSDGQKAVAVWFNNKGWATSVSYLSAFNSMLLRSMVPQAEKHLYGIEVINHPLNFTKLQLRRELIKQSGISLLHAICVIFAMSLVPASFILYLIEERQSHSKHVQFVSGLRPLVYWVAQYTWDLSNYLVSATLCVLIFLAFGEEAYVSEQNLPGLVLLLLLYGWASIPIMYPASFVFQIPASAFVTLACTNLFIGIVSTVATFVLEIFDDEELQYIASILKRVFLLFPHYCLGRGVMDMAANQIRAQALTAFGLSARANLFDWDFLGRNFVCMLAQGVFGFLVTLAIEYVPKRFGHVLPVGRRPVSVLDVAADGPEDCDVASERERVLSGAQDDVLIVSQLTKRYGKQVRPAVDRLCVGVARGECFGLLGVNGAGKTSTFKMLTGQVRSTSGDASVCGHSVRHALGRLRQHIGYCPQFDALDPLLTAREHLQFYGRLRGVNVHQLTDVVNQLIRQLALTAHADQPAGIYSGGNRRKLATAVALVGSPRLVLLDEPTSGMDPVARRYLWSCVTDVLRSGRSVVLTSHSMEECEALCTRLAIMVNGRLRCIGSVQHLKSRFGDGYTVVIRVPQGRATDDVRDRVLEALPTARVRETHHMQVRFHLDSRDLGLAHVFRLLESLRLEGVVEDYSINQTTLDDVFVRFAAEQSDCPDAERINAPSVQTSCVTNRRSSVELDEIIHSECAELTRSDALVEDNVLPA